MKARPYQELLASPDVIAIGMEGIDFVVKLKSEYPHLRVGYITVTA